METLGDHAPDIKNRWELTERVRIRLARHISAGLAGDENLPIQLFTISQDLQDRIALAWERDRDEIRLGLPRQIVESLACAIQDAAKQMISSDLRPIALVDQSIRPVIAELAIDHADGLFVLGSRELENAKIEVVGEITADQLNRIPQAA